MTAAKRIAEIKARAEAATPGEWQHQDDMYWGAVREAGHQLFAHSRDIAEAQIKNDCRFVAHARTDIPWLLARLERAEQLLRLVHESDLRDIHVAIDPQIGAFLAGEDE